MEAPYHLDEFLCIKKALEALMWNSWVCSDYVLLVLSACGTVLYSRNPRRGLTSLASPREVSKRRRPERTPLRGSLAWREPNDKPVRLPSCSVCIDGIFKPQLNERGTALIAILNFTAFNPQLKNILRPYFKIRLRFAAKFVPTINTKLILHRAGGAGA